MAELTDGEKEFLADLTEWMTALGMESGGVVTAPNDWTLVVKLHAMIETALNTVLAARLSPELARVIAKLDTSNMATGKIAFAKALGILAHSSTVFIQKLSELRNFCVHDIRNFNFNLTEYISKLRDDDRKALLKAVNKEIKPDSKVSEPHEALMIATMNTIMQLRVHHLRCETKAMEAKADRLAAELLRAQKESKTKESPARK